MTVQIYSAFIQMGSTLRFATAIFFFSCQENDMKSQGRVLTIAKSTFPRSSSSLRVLGRTWYDKCEWYYPHNPSARQTDQQTGRQTGWCTEIK